VQKLFSENRGEVIVPVEVESPEVTLAPKTGSIGVGTWRTEAEFKDIRVTRDGQTLFSADFNSGTRGWTLHGGDWTVKDGALRQKSLSENIRAFAGDKHWGNYTYSLKARKLSGEEGFLIPFLVQDEEAKAWWNIGGWGNTRHAIEMDGIFANEVAGQIETDRWYDIRIELSDSRIKCFLNEKLIHDITYPRNKSLYAVASLTSNRHEAIIKVVNVSRENLDTEIRVTGGNLSGTATTITLSSEKPEDENTLDEPHKVVPRTGTFACASSTLRQKFPGNSVTILRLPVQ
jgi:alpha-L-arabinofuranosidase